MRSGYQLRQMQQQEARGNAPCPHCPHPNYVHRELARVLYSLNADRTGIIETPNPDYVPVHFHCQWPDGCGCVVTVTGSGRTRTVEKVS